MGITVGQLLGPANMSLVIDLPRQGAVVTRCAGGFVENRKQASADCQITPGFDNPRLVIKRTLAAGQSNFVAMARIIGSPGIWLSATPSHADIRLPIIYDAGSYVGSIPHSAIPVVAAYYMPEAPKWSWSGILPMQVAEHFVTWNSGDDHPTGQSSPISGVQEDIPPPISGVRQDVIESDSNKVFIAGALLGIAGGSLIAAVQSAVAIIQRKQDQRRQAQN
jgi:hypothetical protein